MDARWNFTVCSLISSVVRDFAIRTGRRPRARARRCSRVVSDSISGSVRRAGESSNHSFRQLGAIDDLKIRIGREPSLVSASSSSDARPLTNTVLAEALVDRIGEKDSFDRSPHRNHWGRSVGTARWRLRTRILLTLDSWTLADRHGYIDGTRAANHRDRNGGADLVAAKPSDQCPRHLRSPRRRSRRSRHRPAGRRFQPDCSQQHG